MPREKAKTNELSLEELANYLLPASLRLVQRNATVGQEDCKHTLTHSAHC
jgi:hypothetical protein